MIKHYNIISRLWAFHGSSSGRMGKSNKVVQTKKGAIEKISGPVTVNASGDIRLAILAKPGAKVSSVTGIEPEGVGVQIAAKPVDGEANEELVFFISKVLELKKSQVSLDRGSKSRQKTLIISSTVITAEAVLEKLKAAAKN